LRDHATHAHARTAISTKDVETREEVEGAYVEALIRKSMMLCGEWKLMSFKRVFRMTRFSCPASSNVTRTWPG
jgi:hypothetical protein